VIKGGFKQRHFEFMIMYNNLEWQVISQHPQQGIILMSLEARLNNI
jgi:hypothetical protein